MIFVGGGGDLGYTCWIRNTVQNQWSLICLYLTSLLLIATINVHLWFLRGEILTFTAFMSSHGMTHFHFIPHWSFQWEVSTMVPYFTLPLSEVQKFLKIFRDNKICIPCTMLGLSCDYYFLTESFNGF